MLTSNPSDDGRPQPLVSAAITAFNSARWLPRALDSVLSQQAEFPIEIVLGDDCSQDATLEVARSYQERHPGVIRILERAHNIGIQRNYFETFENCRGKYIAWLDADDYWTDPEKVAIQAHTFESDSSVNVCCHFVRRITPTGEVKSERFPSLPAGRYGLEQIIRRNFMSSPSIMFRNGIHRDLPAWYLDFPNMTDWPILVMAALTGDIVLLDRIMADYTFTPGSAFESKGPLKWNEMDARFYELIENVLPPKWHRLVRAEKGKRYEYVAYLLRQEGDFTGSRLAAVKAFRSPAIVDNVVSKTKSLLGATLREAQWRVGGRRIAS